MRFDVVPEMKWIPRSKSLVATSVFSSVLGFLVILFGERIAYRIDPPWTQEQQLDFMLQQARWKMILKEKFHIPFSSLSGHRKPDIALPTLRIAPAILFGIGVLSGLISAARRDFIVVAIIGVSFNVLGAILFFQGGLL